MTSAAQKARPSAPWTVKDTMTYRPEIDGLRAIAVLAVILYHAGVTQLAGGFAGVDVFFVISGFLITQIIYTGSRDGRLSLLHFYERRARRILPALFVMILVSAPLLFWVLAPFQLKDYVQSVIATLVYLSNVLFWREAGYFAVEAAQKPLLHTWSLAIEEQYYLVFPLVLLVLHRLGYGMLIAVLALAALGSFTWMLQHKTVDASAAFYLIQYRAWELLAGSMAAIWVVRRAPAAQPALSGLGMALVLLGLFVTSDAGTWPSALTLVPVVGTVLVLVFTDARGPVGRVLAHEIPRRIGLMSYSLYLWHFPLLVALRVWYLGDPPVLAILMTLVLTFLCARASWRFVETPFRDVRTTPGPVILATLAAAMLALGVFGYTGHRSNGFFDAKLAMMPLEAREHVIDREAEISERLARWAPLDVRSADPFPAASGVRRILILGDSMSEDLMMAVAMPPEHGPVTSFRRLPLDDACMGAAAHVLAASERAWDLDSPQGCADELADLWQADLLGQADEVVLTAGWQAETVDEALALAAALRDAGKTVSVVGIAAFNDMTSLSMMLGRLQQPVEAFLFANLRSRFVEINDTLAAGVAGLEGVRFLDKLALFCDREAGRCDMLDAAGRLPIFDASHLTLGGLAMFGDRIHAQGWFRLAATASEG